MNKNVRKIKFKDDEDDQLRITQKENSIMKKWREDYMNLSLNKK